MRATNPRDKAARTAGAVYLSMVVTAPFSMIYVPRTLIAPGDATATANNVLAHEALFRLGTVGELVTAVILILLVMTLHRLLSGVNENHARLMVGLVLVSAAVTFVNVVNNIAALTLFRGADFLSALAKPQRDALAMLFLRLHSQTNFVNETFWGLWLLPFGLLVMRSGFLPRILGVLLIVNCFAYVAASLTWLLLPACGNVVSVATLPALLGELWIMLWLLIKGAKVPQPRTASLDAE
jgi:hypothetical protein